MNVSQMHYAKWKKPTKKPIYYVIEFYDFLEKAHVKIRGSVNYSGEQENSERHWNSSVSSLH